jgi:hypothetical protein
MFTLILSVNRFIKISGNLGGFRVVPRMEKEVSELTLGTDWKRLSANLPLGGRIHEIRVPREEAAFFGSFRGWTGKTQK